MIFIPRPKRLGWMKTFAWLPVQTWEGEIIWLQPVMKFVLNVSSRKHRYCTIETYNAEKDDPRYAYQHNL